MFTFNECLGEKKKQNLSDCFPLLSGLLDSPLEEEVVTKDGKHDGRGKRIYMKLPTATTLLIPR